MSELEKLEKYLKEKGIKYERKDADFSDIDPIEFPFGLGFDRHQIIVKDENDTYKWDAICHRGSYGYEDGLLEIMGDIVDREEVGDTVEGWLTAEDVIERMKLQKGAYYHDLL